LISQSDREKYRGVKRKPPMSKRPIGRPKTRWEDDFWKI